MAAVVGDYSSVLSRFHTMTVGSDSHPPQQQHHHHQQQQHLSETAHPSPKRARASRDDTATSSPRILSNRSADDDQSPPRKTPTIPIPPGSTGSTGASRFPSPPSLSSPATRPDPSKPMASQLANVAASQAPPGASPGAAKIATPQPPHQQQQPSPPTDDFRVTNPSSEPNFHSRQAPTGHVIPEDATIHIRDLAHVQSLARNQVLGAGPAGSTSQEVKYEISQMPIGDVIEMVAALLTKITTTNDLQHDAMQRNAAHQQQANQNHDASSSSMSPLSHSVLAFHGKNVPAITILSYLARIHKYCPTTYEVFLSLLVYFDRMTERVNELAVKGDTSKRPTPVDGGAKPREHDDMITVESDSDLADDDDDDSSMVDTPSMPSRPESRRISAASERLLPGTPATYFVVDSFNIHRLIISGVTCASKFFSDVFYTNSRYAKVGGLPLAELNHLELQFLVLNDFRLAIPVEELEAYGTMLVEFYAREVVVKNTVE